MQKEVTPQINIEKLSQWFKKNIAVETGVSENEIRLDVPLDSYTMDSLSFVTLSYELGIYLNTEIDPTIFWEFKTINELIEWLLQKKN